MPERPHVGPPAERNCRSDGMVSRAAAEDLDCTRPRLGKWAGTFPLRDGLATAGRDTDAGEVTHVPVRRAPRYLCELSFHTAAPSACLPVPIRAIHARSAKHRLAGRGGRGNRVAGPDHARDGAFGSSRSDGVMPPSLRAGLRALGSSPVQPSAPMAGGPTTAPVDASAAAIVVAASTSFDASCEPQAAGCTLHRRCASP